MAHLKQTNRRRSSSLCYRHPSSKPTTSGFCASCLRERLVTIEAQSSSPAAIQTPDLRRLRSSSVRNVPSASVYEQPRRRSCDARSSASSLHDLFVDDDEERLDSSTRKPLVPELKEEEEDYYEGEDIKGFDEGKPRKIVEEESDEDKKKTMKEFIDLDWRNQTKKNNGSELKELASSWSKKLKRFSLNHHKNDDKSDARFAGRRRSCDIDPRLSLDGGRISFEKPRASWDGCLVEKSYSKLTTLSTVTESLPEKKPLEEEEEEVEEKSPGGTVQTRKYYSDSRRRRSFERSISIKRQGLFEVDELKAISNAKVSPETLGLFHGAKLLVTEKELRDSNWYSIQNHKPESIELGSKGKISVAASERKQDSVELKKPRKKWPKGWNLWGLIQRKNETKNNNDIKTEQSLKLQENAIEGSLAESLLKLRRVSKGETNGGVSEKLLKSYSVSARKSCDGVYSGANIVSGFERGRSSCDGLFHGSNNSVEVGRSSCDGLLNGTAGKPNHHLHQRKANDGTYARENIDNSLFRFYLTPVRSHKTSKSGKSRLMS